MTLFCFVYKRIDQNWLFFCVKKPENIRNVIVQRVQVCLTRDVEKIQILGLKQARYNTCWVIKVYLRNFK